VPQTALESCAAIRINGLFPGHKLREHLEHVNIGTNLMRRLPKIVPRSEVDALALFEQENDDVCTATFAGEVQSCVSFMVCYVEVAFGGLQSPCNRCVASDTGQVQRSSVSLGYRVGPDIFLGEQQLDDFKMTFISSEVERSPVVQTSAVHFRGKALLRAFRQ